MYCQSCGAQNAGEAKFCNQCGTSIAAPGEKGGPIQTQRGAGAASGGQAQPAAGGPQNSPAATAVGMGIPQSGAAPVSPPPGGGAYSPYGGQSMLSVSLSSIGVQPSRKIWTIIAVSAVALMALGALGMYLFTGGEPEVAVDQGHAEPDDPFVIGSPLPPGAETPEVDFVTGSGGSGSEATMGSTGGSGSSSTMQTTRTTSMRAGGSGSSMSSGGSGGSGSSGSGSSGSGSSGSGSSGSGSSGSGSSGSGSTGSGSSGSGSEMSSGSAGGASQMTGGSTGVGDLEAPEERDLEMDLYGSRVRFVVRRYYAARAQTCFDRATRNNPTISGTVVVAMQIGADGAVTRARVARNTTGNDALGNCLQAQVGTWRLPPPPGGALEMQMPFSR